MNRYLVFDLETTGLDPNNSQILCCGLMILDVDDNKTVINRTPVQIIYENIPENLTEIIKTSRITHIVGFNIENFDIPFLIHKSDLQTRSSLINILNNIKIIDLRTYLNPDKYAKGRLGDYLKSYDIENNDKFTGRDMPKAFKEGNFEAIKSHVTHDIKATSELFEKAYLMEDRRPPTFDRC